MCIPDQQIPVVVADFMAEVADQCTVGFIHCRANFFAPGIIGFLRVKRDQAVGVSCHDPLAVIIAAQDIEGQALLGVLLFRFNRQAQGQQL